MLALSQFVMTLVLGWMYLRKADSEFDPLAARAREAAVRVGAGDGAPTRRFRQGAIVDEPTGPSTGGEVPPR